MAPGMAGVSLVRFQGSSGWDGSGGWSLSLVMLGEGMQMVSLPVRVVVGVMGRPELECWFQGSSGWNGVVRGGAGGSCNRSGGRKVTLGGWVAWL